ncbi:serine/threonine-protein kinase [Actinocorallia longicatena]
MPTAVGRYRIDRVLGQGAFASVWLGLDDDLNDRVAIKVLSGSLLDDLDVRNRFLEEARILRRADSERLVRVHEFGELPDGRPYFVMSHADRGSLADRMAGRPLPVTEALGLIEEIARGVEVINELGVIHRDLKPSNILFQTTKDGQGERCLIADLGLAKALAHASGAFTLPVGTPGYMSPEQARFGGGLDVRADVYGIGALSYHLLTGRPPGPAPVRTKPSQVNPEISPAIEAVILKALEANRDNRFDTAGDYADAIAALRRGESPLQAPSAVPPEVTQIDRLPAGFEPYARVQPPAAAQDDIPTGRFEAVDPDKTAALNFQPRDRDATFLDPRALVQNQPPTPPVQPGGYQPPAGPYGDPQYRTPVAPTPKAANRLLIPAVVAAGVLVIGAVAVVLVKVSGGGDSGKKTPPPANVVSLTDAAAKITVSVPKEWQQDATEQTWSPAANNLTGDASTTRPVLRASTDPTRFRGVEQTNGGVFIGLTTAPTPMPATLSDHARAGNGGCTKGNSSTKTVGTLTFTITDWTACKTGVPVIKEIAAVDSSKTFGAWIRIKQATGAADVTNQILDSLKLSAPA